MYRRHRLGSFAVVVLTLVIVIGAFVLADLNFRPVILGIAEAKVTQIATGAIHEAVRQEVSEDKVAYEDLIALHKDNEGHIVLMQANTIKANQVASRVTLAVNESMRDLEDKKIGIPLGQVLGSHFLAAYGPKLNVRLIPEGSVKVDVHGVFEEAGINQTRHRLFLSMDTAVKIIVPFNNTEVSINTTVPITENILLGTVPDVFVDMNFPEIFSSGSSEGSIKGSYFNR